jgi:hypothetical protein
MRKLLLLADKHTHYDVDHIVIYTLSLSGTAFVVKTFLKI